MFIRRALMLLCVFSGLSACGGSPTSPDPVTDTFGGSLAVNGSVWHVFTTSASGTVLVEMTALGQAGATVGLGLGVGDASSCTIQYVQTGMKAGSQWGTSLSNKGSYCVAVYDTGLLAATTTYGLKVTHP